MQVVSQRTADAQAAGQQDMERAHVPVSVEASVEQVYATIKVNVQSHVVLYTVPVCSLHVCEFVCHVGVCDWLTT